jgi:hypothetical protein
MQQDQEHGPCVKNIKQIAEYNGALSVPHLIIITPGDESRAAGGAKLLRFSVFHLRKKNI